MAPFFPLFEITAESGAPLAGQKTEGITSIYDLF